MSKSDKERLGSSNRSAQSELPLLNYQEDYP
jgi:hypothetical protein